jgi:hypothetical protein
MIGEANAEIHPPNKLGGLLSAWLSIKTRIIMFPIYMLVIIWYYFSGCEIRVFQDKKEMKP